MRGSLTPSFQQGRCLAHDLASPAPAMPGVLCTDVMPMPAENPVASVAAGDAVIAAAATRVAVAPDGDEGVDARAAVEPVGDQRAGDDVAVAAATHPLDAGQSVALCPSLAASAKVDVNRRAGVGVRNQVGAEATVDVIVSSARGQCVSPGIAAELVSAATTDQVIGTPAPE